MIRSTMKSAEHMMTTKVPWRIIKVIKGQIHDAFEFDTKALFMHLIIFFGLEEKVKRGDLEMVIKIEGVKLDAQINHITWGFKVTNFDSRCRFAKKLIYSELKTTQSDRWSFPGKTIFKDDNKETYDTSFPKKNVLFRKYTRWRHCPKCMRYNAILFLS
jgi:hypothetical protein